MRVHPSDPQLTFLIFQIYSEEILHNESSSEHNSFNQESSTPSVYQDTLHSEKLVWKPPFFVDYLRCKDVVSSDPILP